MKAHIKHPSLSTKRKGNFAPNELALVGATCSDIESLASRWILREGSKFKMGYMDADHQQSDVLPHLLQTGANTVVTDKIQFLRNDRLPVTDPYGAPIGHNELDLLLINGNHFSAAQQVLIIDPDREKSILKRLDQLTDVRLILVKHHYSIPEQVSNVLGNRMSEIPLISWDDQEAVDRWFSAYMHSLAPPIKALILVGGQSQRMGRDKSSIAFHGVPQRQYLAKMVQESGIEPILSVQQSIPGDPFVQLADTFLGLGPMGAILSAFQSQPDVAWLVIACDMPFIDKNAINRLVQGRNPSSYATAFLNPATSFADPLFAIYEPKAYLRLLHFMWQGHSCPRKMLINSDITLLTPDDATWLRNVNTPEELETYFREQTPVN